MSKHPEKPETPLHDPFYEREAEKYDNPIPSREYILETLVDWDRPVKKRELQEAWGFESEDLQEALRRRLKAMVRDGQLILLPQGFLPVVRQERHTGTLVIAREGEGWLKTSEGLLPLSGSLRGYYEGDEVEAESVFSAQNHERTRVVHLIQPITPVIVGKVIQSPAGLEVLSFNKKISLRFRLREGKHKGAKVGDIVQICVLRAQAADEGRQPMGEVLEVMGNFDTPGIEIKMAIKQWGLREHWPQPVCQEAEERQKEAILFEETPSRKKLEFPFVTIDGEDAKDFDDAVYCEALKEEGFRLWVAIADVSYYVEEGSALDREAEARGNSTYFPNKVIPMLPEILSNDLCSLKPSVPRYTLVCEMTINPRGTVVHSTFYRAVIVSHARLTYTNASLLVEGDETLKKRHQKEYPSLLALSQLYHLLEKERRSRGTIDFHMKESKILLDAHGKIETLLPEERTLAHRMIEESMLAANVCAATFIHRHKRQALYRIHDKPTAEKLNSLRLFLAGLGLSLTRRKEPTSKDFSDFLHQIQNRDDRHILEVMMLRSLSQAQYSPSNIGHFGLAYPYYTHFTSPIRRYPDLTTHRVILEILTHKKKEAKNRKRFFEKLGEHCSYTERRSDEATREAITALKCYYMRNKVGSVYQGLISGVTGFGLFVTLKDMDIEGLVHVTDLGNEYFHYDPEQYRMIGEATRTEYRLGNTVTVKIEQVDLETKRIALTLWQDGHTPRDKRRKRRRGA